MEEKPKTIYFTDDPDTGIVHPDYIPDDEFPETGSVIVYLVVCLGILLAIGILFCLTYFN